MNDIKNRLREAIQDHINNGGTLISGAYWGKIKDSECRCPLSCLINFDGEHLLEAQHSSAVSYEINDELGWSPLQTQMFVMGFDGFGAEQFNKDHPTYVLGQELKEEFINVVIDYDDYIHNTGE